MRGEPILTGSAIVAVITAGLQWVRLMGWIDWTDEQFNQFMLFMGLVVPLAGGFIMRTWVTPLSNPKAKTEDGSMVGLVRADTGLPPGPPASKREVPQ